MIGRTLSHYRITAAVGAGGMGEVYRATDTTLGREVALKLLPPAFASDAERLARFEREAKLLASLNHPGIAHLYGFEAVPNPDGTSAHLLIMELVEGEDLSERLACGALPLDEALHIAGQVAEALEEAHEKGIVHRDLKPANVKVTPDGRVKVLDFGLAKAWIGDASGAVSSADLSQSPTLAHAGTAAGLILGTAAYMSPEQARGKPVDRRSDIWSFGVVLYELLTGKAPFRGETVSDVLASVLAREIDWSPLPAGTPPPVRRLLGRCLERDPRRRLRDIGDALHEIREAGAAGPADSGPGQAQPSVARNRTRRLVAAAALAGAVAGVAVMAWRTDSVPNPPAVFSLPAPDGTRLNNVVISPDGRSLALAAESVSGESHLWLRQLDSRDATRIEGTEGAREPFWSPDSRFVGFFTEARLWKVEVATGVVEALAGSTSTRGGAWQPDGTVVFGGDELRRVPASGGAAVTVLDADAATGENNLRYPSFLPDGSHVLFYSRNARDRTRAGLWVVSLDSGERRQLTAAAASSAVYVEPGYLLYRRDRYLVAHPFDARRLELRGEPRTVAEDVWYDPGVTSQTNVSVSSTGTLTFRAGGVELSDLVWFDREGRRLGTEWEAKGFTSFSLSADGRQILAALPGQGVERRVWLYDREAASARQVTSAGDTISLVFSDDGTRALLGMHGAAASGLWLTRLGSGTAPEHLAEESLGSDTQASDWRGGQIVFSANAVRADRESSSIVAFDLEAGVGQTVVDTPGSDMFGVISPDGRRLAYASDETGQWEVYVTSFPEGSERWRISTAGGHQPRWSPDGSELFFIAPDRQLMSARVRAGGRGFEWDAPRALFQTAIVDVGAFRGCGSYAVAPDGQRFLVLSRRSQGSSPAVAMLNWTPEP